MRPTIIIAVIFSVSVVFLGGLSGGNSGQEEYPYDSQGRVMGVQEINSEITLKDIGINIESFPASAKKAVLEPEKALGSEFKLEKCLGAAIDAATGKVLYANDAGRRVPIASITKLVTALVFLDNDPLWDSYYTITDFDIVSGGRIYLAKGDKVKLRDLFYLSLVGSSNSAAQALVNSTLPGNEEFVSMMNKKAAELGLLNTEFVDPIGLGQNNISTAPEVAKIARAALARPEIAEAAGYEKYEFYTAAGARRTVDNTNLLLSSFPSEEVEMIGGKTGFTDLAGYCFAGKFKDSHGHEIVTAILGGDKPNSRFAQTKRLVSWVYNSYRWQQ